MHRSILVVAAAVAFLATPAQAAEPKKVPPNWLKQPTGDELLEFLPAKAAKEGQDGKAVIDCDIGVDGNLRNCRVVSETPEGFGFGQAALLAAPLFKMKPGTVDGKPVPGTARIPVSWEIDRGVGEGKPFGMVARPIWLEAPTRADVRAARPDGATAAGRVVLNCGFKVDGTLTDCEEKESSPKNRGFVPAARKLIGRFRSAGAASLKDARILLPIEFDPVEGPDLQDGRLLGKPVWAQRANPGALAFPSAARAAGLGEGRAVVECAVAAQGRLTDCRAVSESTGGVGFGETAVAAAALFKVSAWTDEGRPVDGARVRLGFRFLDEAAPAKAAPAPAGAPGAGNL